MRLAVAVAASSAEVCMQNYQQEKRQQLQQLQPCSLIRGLAILELRAGVHDQGKTTTARRMRTKRKKKNNNRYEVEEEDVQKEQEEEQQRKQQQQQDVLLQLQYYQKVAVVRILWQLQS